jgi:hypothetical protein
MEPKPYDRIIFTIGKIRSIMNRNKYNNEDFAEAIAALEDAEEKLITTQRKITEF